MLSALIIYSAILATTIEPPNKVFKNNQTTSTAVIPPKIIKYVDPVYPSEALAAHIEGLVTLTILLDENGQVQRVVVIEDPGYGLALASLIAIANFNFEPATFKGKPIPVEINYQMRFNLKSKIPISIKNLVGKVMNINGEVLPQARVLITSPQKTSYQTHTDGQGNFSFSNLKPDTYQISILAPNYPEYNGNLKITAIEHTEVQLKLPPFQHKPYETLILARRFRKEIHRRPIKLDVTPSVSRYELTRRDIELTPGSLEDISRTIQSLPGVVGDPGLMATFFVRGGDADEVLFYLDGIPLANAFHLGGFATIFNPELIEMVEFHAGGQPARYRNSLSGILDLGYVSGNHDLHQGLIDISMNTAKAVASGPTGIDNLSFLLSARRSYFEAYFKVMNKFGIIGKGMAAPNLGEYLAKLTKKLDQHTLNLTFLHATDGLHFTSQNEDEAIIKFDGELKINNSLSLMSFRWDSVISNKLTTQAVLAYMHDINEIERHGSNENNTDNNTTGALLNSGNLTLDNVVGRFDLNWTFAKNYKLQMGVDVSWRKQKFVGLVADTRTLPTWASTPLANYQLETLNIKPSQAHTEISTYVETELPKIALGLTPRIGLRLDGRLDFETLFSPRFSLSWAIFEGTVLKLATGLYYQRPTDPLMLDASYGNTKLKAERALPAIFGIEQLLPIKTMLRFEAYYKKLTNLIVNPDNKEAIEQGITFTNDGRGYCYGMDFIILHRGDIFGAGLSYGFLKTERNNPLNEIFVKKYIPLQQQTHTFGISGDIRYQDTWTASLRFKFHTSRPHTPITGWDLGQKNGDPIWVPIIGKTKNDRRQINNNWNNPFYELSARVEYWLRRPSLRATIYAEILNITNYTTKLFDSYDDGNPSKGEKPKKGAFDTLPIRPFLGIRAEI